MNQKSEKKSISTISSQITPEFLKTKRENQYSECKGLGGKMLNTLLGRIEVI